MGVACFNAQSVTRSRGNDLEHTGHTSFSHSQRQPARLTGACAQDATPVLLDKGLHAETNLWPCSGLDWLATGGLRFGGLNCLLIPAWWLAESCQWQAMATYLAMLSFFYNFFDW